MRSFQVLYELRGAGSSPLTVGIEPEVVSVTEIRRIWKEYQLGPRTRFKTLVTSVKRVPGTAEHIKDDPAHSQSKWTINSGEDGEFDAVVVTVGTCGIPMRIDFPGLPQHYDNTAGGDGKHEGREEVFEGEVFHSSELDDAPLEGKRIIVIGSGASGVESVETALSKGAKHCVMLAREDKVLSMFTRLLAVLTPTHFDSAYSGSFRETSSSTRSSPHNPSGARCRCPSCGRG